MTVSAKYTNTLSAETLEAAREKRRQAAREAFEKNAYQIRFSGKDDQGRYAWEVRNGEGQTYIVSLADGRYACTCPDFVNRGAQLGLCKHTELVRLRREALKQAKANGQAPAPKAAQAPKPAGKPANGQAPAPEASPKAATEAAEEDPGEMVVPWGKHKGRKLAELANEAPGFLAWLAFKMEVKTDQDRALQEAARKVFDRIKASRASKASKGRTSDPAAAFIASAGVELLKELWRAQENGRDINDPVVRRALELRLQAIRMVAGLLREI